MVYNLDTSLQDRSGYFWKMKHALICKLTVKMWGLFILIFTVFVVGVFSLVSLMNGFVFGQVAAMISSLQKKEEGIDLSENEISLITSLITILCLVGFACAAIATDRLGRRWPLILFSIVMVSNWIILYYSRQMYQFLLSRTIGGISLGALSSLVVFIPSEYTSPKNRAFCLNMVTTASPAIGASIAHAIGIVLHWRTVTLIGAGLSALGIILPYFCVESPHWLASKGRFEECAAAFRVLHGNKPSAERELQLLIKMEKSKLEKANEINSNTTVKKLLLASKRKYYWGLIGFSIAINAYFAAAGKHLFNVLATVILEEITGTSDVLLFTLLVDGFIVVGSCMSCFLIRKTSMRTLLFSSGIAANIILILFSGGFYFKNGQSYFNWINVTLLAFYFIIVNSGPYPITEVILSEIFPLELKMYTFVITGITMIGFLSLSIYFYPFTVASIGYHGLFLTNAAIMFLSLGYMWLKLPETKGKTLQEIETYFKTKNFDVDEVLSNSHTKALI